MARVFPAPCPSNTEDVRVQAVRLVAHASQRRSVVGIAYAVAVRRVIVQAIAERGVAHRALNRITSQVAQPFVSRARPQWPRRHDPSMS
jgi:4'-phosphopantetheinyl transferase EntD